MLNKIFIILLPYLSFEDLEVLSNVIKVYDCHYEILYNQHFGVKKSFKESYRKYHNSIKKLNNDQIIIINNLNLKINIDEILGYFIFNDTTIYYVTKDYRYFLFENLKLKEIGFQKEILKQSLYFQYYRYQCDHDCTEPLPIFDKNGKVYSWILEEKPMIYNSNIEEGFDYQDFILNHYKDENYSRSHSKITINSTHRLEVYVKYKKFNILFKMIIDRHDDKKCYILINFYIN
jgi:hypothetical protein